MAYEALHSNCRYKQMCELTFFLIIYAVLPKLKLPQTRILAHINTESCLQQNTSAFKCQRVILKEDVAERIPSNQWPYGTKVYHFFSSIQICILFEVRSRSREDDQIISAHFSRNHFFVRSWNWRVSFQKWNSIRL